MNFQKADNIRVT